MRRIAFMTVMACLLCVVAGAQTVPNFQGIMQNLQAKLDVVTTGTWTTSVWNYVSPGSGSQPFAQKHPSFIGRDHTGNGIWDDAHLALLQTVLEGDACTRELLGDAFVDGVRAAFFQNQANVTNRETWFNLRLWNTTRIDIRYQSLLDVNNRPAWTDPAVQTITTGTSNNLRLCVDTGHWLVGTTCIAESADVPSLWGDDGLLSEASPGLGDDIRDLMAAYLTIGSQNKVDYMQALLYQVMCRGVLPNITTLILSMLGKGDPELYAEPELLWDADLLGSDKAYNAPNVGDINVDQSFDPPRVVADDGDLRIRIRRIVATVYGNSMQQGVGVHWVNWYTVNANGFHSGYANRLTGGVKLNPTMVYLNNQQAWLWSGQDAGQFAINAGAALDFLILGHPSAPPGPVNYGGVYTMGVNATTSASGTIEYRWYAGPTAGSMTPITAQHPDNHTYTTTVNFYSWGGTTNSRFFRAEALLYACGGWNTRFSNTIEIVGGDPPPITIHSQPSGGSFQPGASTTLSVTAGVSVGTLSYQWQKHVYDGEFWAWENLPGKTSNTLSFASLSEADDGDYRCRVSNIIAGKEDKANPEYWVFTNTVTLDVAPTIVFTVQPQGADLEIGDNHTLSVAAEVAAGNLEYRWQHAPMGAWTNLTGWEDAGASSFTSDWNIVNAQLTHAGSYRVQVRNTLAPFGTYSRNSAAAGVNVSSGAVFRVDKNAPGDVRDGLTWETAFSTIQDGITAAAGQPDGGEVWVAAGVYDEPRTVPWGGAVGDPGRVVGSLVMRSNVGLFGGFSGYNGLQEERRMERNRAQNITVIDGSTSRAGSPAYHVVVFGSGSAPVANATIDGFVITGGDAAGIGGVYHASRGGGIYNWQSAPTIINCVIEGNSAAVSGGGIANETGPNGTADAQIINCLIRDNHAARTADTHTPGAPNPPYIGGPPNPIRGGGGVFNNYASPTYTHVTILNNTLGAFTPAPLAHYNYGQGSGGMLSWTRTDLYSPPTMVNSIVWANPAGGLEIWRATSMDGMNHTVTFSDIQGGVHPGANNISANPNLDADGVPQAGSPVINQAAELIGDDLRGVWRLNPPGPDMGALEYSANAPTPVCLPQSIDFIEVPDTDGINPWDVYDSENSSSEAPIVSVELTYYEFGCGDLGGAQIELVATDILGRAGTCMANVAVTESEDPVPPATPNAITVELSDDPGAGTYTLDAADIAALSAGWTDNCGINAAATIVTPTTFTCANLGNNSVLVTVFDTVGNSASTTASVFVEDNSPPVPVCGSIERDLSQFGQYVLTQADLQALAAGSTDNCSINWVASSATPNIFSCANIHAPVTVTITLRDFSGNSATCVDAEVIVNDVTDPLFVGTIPNRTTTVYGAVLEEDDLLVNVVAQDGCDGDLSDVVTASLELDGAPVSWPFDPADQGLNPGDDPLVFDVIYDVADSSGNTAQAFATMTLYAIEMPEINLAGDDPLTLECPAVYQEPGYTAWDNEEDVDITDNVVVTVPPALQGASQVGIHTITYQVSALNYPTVTVMVERTVIVEDNVVPVISLIGPATIAHMINTPFDDPGATAMDACEGDITAMMDVVSNVNVNVAGEYTITYNVADSQDNIADEVVRTVLVGELVTFTEQPVGTRLYTTDPIYDMQASWRGGINTTGYEWYRGLSGLGEIPFSDTENTAVLSINPATHALGVSNYSVVVYDQTGETASNAATVEVAAPISAGALADIALGEGDNYTWSLTVTGGLGSLNYQWLASLGGAKAFEPVVNGPFGEGAYAGAQTSALEFTPFTAAMVGQYQVEVSDDYSTVVVGPANVTLDFGVPVAGAVGLAALALATALGGMAAMRRRK